MVIIRETQHGVEDKQGEGGGQPPHAPIPDKGKIAMGEGSQA